MTASGHDAVAWMLADSAATLRRLLRDTRPIREAAAILERCFRRGNTVFFFGNGGSASEAQHLAAELIGRFRSDRRPYAALALTADSSALTAVANDFGYDQVFSRQLRGLARPGDVAVGLSTSGRSANVVTALRVARRLGAATIGLTGLERSAIDDWADVAIHAPSRDTARIQEAHTAVGHVLCELVEHSLAGTAPPAPVPEASDKLLSWPRLVEVRRQLRARGRSVVWTNGCFDLLHLGHVRMLEFARSQGDVLIVGVNDDETLGAGKRRPPVVPFDQRAALVAALELVDFVVAVTHHTPTGLIRQLRPDVCVKGGNYGVDDMPEAEAVLDCGGRVAFAPFVRGLSSTALRLAAGATGGGASHGRAGRW